MALWFLKNKGKECLLQLPKQRKCWNSEAKLLKNNKWLLQLNR